MVLATAKACRVVAGVDTVMPLCWLGMPPKNWEGGDALNESPGRCSGVWTERMASVGGCGERRGGWSPRLQTRQSRAWPWEEALGAQGRERPLELRRQVTWVPVDAERPFGWGGCEGVAAGSRGSRGWNVNPGSVFTHCQANS